MKILTNVYSATLFERRMSTLWREYFAGKSPYPITRLVRTDQNVRLRAIRQREKAIWVRRFNEVRKYGFHG